MPSEGAGAWVARSGVRLTLFPKLLVAFLVVSLPPLLWLSVDASRRIDEVGRGAVAWSTQALDDQARQALQLQAVGLAAEVSSFLEERIQDLRILSELPKTPEVLFLFCRSRTGEVWRRRRGAADAIEDYRVRAPIYVEAAWIGPDGRELYRVDGDWMAPSRSLRAVAEPARTTYGVEAYFAAALDRPPGEAYVGHLVGRHVGKDQQLAGAARPEQAVDGAEYKGHVRFALAVREAGVLLGVLSLALDHTHLMEFSQHVLPLSGERVVFPSYGSGNYAFLFDDEGWIITHPKFWDIRGLDAGGRWVPAYSENSSQADIAAGRIPFHLNHAGFVHPNYPLVAAAVRRGEAGVTQTYNVAGVGKVMAYAPIRFSHGAYRPLGVFGGVTIGALTEMFHRDAVRTGEVIQAAARQTLRTGGLLAWLLALVVAAAAFLLSRAMAGPIHGMAAMAARIAGGDLTARVGIARNDEAGDLARAFNAMAGRLEAQSQRLHESMAELEQSRDAATAYSDRLEEQLRIVNHIQSISRFLGTTFDREEAIRIILRTCVGGLGFDRAAIYVFNPGEDRLVCLAAEGFPGSADAEGLPESFAVADADRVPIHVVRSGQPGQVADVTCCPGLSPVDREWAAHAGVKSFAFAPMKIRDAAVGVLGVGNAAVGGTLFTERVGALQIVAGQAARAIERARLYEEASQARRFVEAVIDSLATGLVTLDVEGKILTVNPYARTALDLDPGRCIGQTLEACGADPRLSAYAAGLGAGGALAPADFEVATARGARVFYWVPSRFQAAGGAGLILQFRDITEEQTMRRALQRVDRLASLGRMAAGVAHEIRNPLTGVALSLDDLHDRLDSVDQRALAARALQEIERLDGIVQELLDYARVDRMERCLCRVEELLEKSLFLVKKQAKRQGVEVVLEVADGLPEVSADPDKLRQALLNLYLNALQVMEPEGGGLRIAAVPTAEGVLVAVEDTGPGVPEIHREHIFEPFWSLRPGGTGLGLSIAHTIVSDHGGSIAVGAAANGGARFEVRLPAADGGAKWQPS